MRVLHLSYADNGGCSYFQSEVINRATKHQARFIRMKQNYLDYPQDIQAPSKSEIKRWYDWADVLHIHDNAHYICGSDWPLKPAVMQYHGSHYRKSPYACQAHCLQRAWSMGGSTIDLTLFGNIVWLPNSRADMSHLRRWKHFPRKRFVVAHCPTQREAKNTDDILPALQKLESEGEIKLMLVEKVTIRECNRRKGNAHLLIDQFLLGYGSNAIEAWAIGMPVIGNALNDIPHAERLRGLDTRDVLAEMKRIIGYLPFCQATFGTLYDVILRFRHDATFWQHWRDVGRQYWHDFHRPEAVAQVLVPLYEQAIEQRKNAQCDTLGRYSNRDVQLARRMRLPQYQPRGGRSSEKPAAVRDRRSDGFLAGHMPPKGQRGKHDLVLVHYLGHNTGEESWHPDGEGCTPTRYLFSANRPDRYVFEPDVPWFLGIRDKNDRKLFVVKGE